jgi:hypothetical protein
MIHNAAYFMGKWLYSDLVGPVMKEWLNEYKYAFKLESPLPG